MPNKSDKTVPKIKIKNNTVVPASTDEDGFRSPRTPRGNKINTNNSPTQSQFVSPNRFAALQDSNIFDFNNTDSTEETVTVTQTHNESTNMDTSKTPPLKRQIPPIFIANQKLGYNLLYKSLINLVGENGFHCKSTQKHTKVQANTSDVQRNLHPSTLCEEIKSSLENFNLSILQVVNIKQRLTKIALPLFFVDLAKDENCKTIFDITSILHTKIKVEEPHKRRELVQCQNCQDYGHTRSLLLCNYNSRCVQCGKNHESSSCDKPNDVPPTCALCQQLQKSRKPTLKFSPQNVIPTHQTNPLATSPAPFPSHAQPQTSYAHITSGTKSNATPTPDQPPQITSALNNFIAEFKSIINPLLSLLTT
ncbi:Uncharacterized protein FWK35_00024837, partial [Aphis craccivora]